MPFETVTESLQPLMQTIDMEGKTSAFKGKPVKGDANEEDEESEEEILCLLLSKCTITDLLQNLRSKCAVLNHLIPLTPTRNDLHSTVAENFSPCHLITRERSQCL